jgi:spore germination protein GerM
MAVKKKRKKSSSGSPGCLILLIGLIILAIVFVIKLPDIKGILERTKFLDLVRENSAKQKEQTPSGKTVTSSTLMEDSDTKRPDTVSGVDDTSPTTKSREDGASSVVDAVDTQGQVDPTLKSSDQSPSDVKVVEPVTRQSSLYFVHIGEDGQIQRHDVKRSIPVSDSPLTDAIEALLAGPSEGEIRSGLVSLIPRSTKLLGIVMKGTTAIIDLSEDFMYNHYGTEGFVAQLWQIVFTATSFSSVQDVQIIIDGQKKEYLGGEGVYIGKPLSRASL